VDDEKPGRDIPEHKKTTLTKPPPLPTYLPPISKKKHPINQQFSEIPYQTSMAISPYNNSYNLASQSQYDNFYNMPSQYSYNAAFLPILEPSYNSIAEFLGNLGENFLEYENKFIEHGYSVAELPYLNMEQLKGIGITKLGHCTRILVALGLPIA
jgi:hypothetical protein